MQIKIVPLRLYLHGMQDGGAQWGIIVRVFAQSGHQINLVILTKAKVKLAFAGNAYTVARRAEVMAVW